jgi:hypothetical protein
MNRIVVVQECDATKNDSSNAAGNIIIINYQAPPQADPDEKRNK